MIIIEDSRQHAGKHELKHNQFSFLDVFIHRCKLPVGDYSLPPERAVDTKASLSEIAENIGGSRKEHNRFINELKLAQKLGTKLYVLVENEDYIRSIDDVPRWVNPRTEYSPNCIQGPRLAKAMHTIEDRYGCTFLFCTPIEAAERIKELLGDKDV